VREYLLASMTLAVAGLVDAALWWSAGATDYGQVFSLLELFWLALSLVALAVGFRAASTDRLPLLVFVAYQLVMWSVGSWLATQSNGHFFPPDAMVIAAVFFYVGYFLLCLRHYRLKK